MSEEPGTHSTHSSAMLALMSAASECVVALDMLVPLTYSKEISKQSRSNQQKQSLSF